MYNAIFRIPTPVNEPVKGYAPGSCERKALEAELEKQYNEKLEIPLIIGGKEIKTGNIKQAVMPTEHGHVLADYHVASEKEIQMAIDAAMGARKTWESFNWVERASIFLKAAELLATKYRYVLNAATILNQGKSPFQAEIDSACELIDFFKFNAYFMQQIYSDQPNSQPGTYNRLEYRPLDGFVFAVTPFNFTSIAGNLPSAPAMMGNTVVWKPASTAILSGYYMMKLFEEAGVPAGVINFIPGRGSEVGKIVFASPYLAGIHFTGSTGTFNRMFKMVGENIDIYKQYPRMVGETGGKDFVFAHESADRQALATALVRGAFEYQGQKCSAASRAYIPENIWEDVKTRMFAQLEQIKPGDVRDLSCFFNAVIDQNAYNDITGYIKKAEESSDAEIIYGGKYDDSKGYFIDPTVILTTDPKFVTMEEEIFGPVLTIYLYKPEDFEKTLELCDETSPYALTGAIWGQDRLAVKVGYEKLRYAAGNFYINDKPTGAVVGEQPFGGARGSGTNDKAGSYLNLIRWTSARTVKETFVPATDFKYPFMG